MMFPITAYIEAALELARYDKLEDGSFAGEIPKLKGVAAFGKSLRVCEDELRSALEEWILVGLRPGHKLSVLAGIDLNKVQNGRMATSSTHLHPADHGGASRRTSPVFPFGPSLAVLNT
jgi:predicted RNase H-like HicB family nuclease